MKISTSSWELEINFNNLFYWIGVGIISAFAVIGMVASFIILVSF